MHTLTFKLSDAELGMVRAALAEYARHAEGSPLMLKSHNARFWVDGPQGSPVKLTLRPGQTIGHRHGWDNGEGWSTEQRLWGHDTTRVLLEQWTSSTDCDGGHSTYDEAECALDDLAHIPDDGSALRWPAWKWSGGTQCEDFAEAMNY